MDDNNKKQKKRIDNRAEDIEEAELEAKSDKQFENRIAELEEQLKRAVADYRNLERRNIEERADAVKFANRQLVESLLPAFDILMLAEKYTTDENIKLTAAKILEVLKENGIEKVATVGAKYNADTMEAIDVEDENSDTVLEELRPGFTLRGKLIRAAQVKVGKRSN